MTVEVGANRPDSPTSASGCRRTRARSPRLLEGCPAGAADLRGTAGTSLRRLASRASCRARTVTRSVLPASNLTAPAIHPSPVWSGPTGVQPAVLMPFCRCWIHCLSSIAASRYDNSVATIQPCDVAHRVALRWSDVRELDHALCSPAASGTVQRLGLRRRFQGLRPTPRVRLEPTTLRLTAGCSAIELLRIGSASLSVDQMAQFAVSPLSASRRSVRVSIWRTRSRVTPNRRPDLLERVRAVAVEAVAQLEDRAARDTAGPPPARSRCCAAAESPSHRRARAAAHPRSSRRARYCLRQPARPVTPAPARRDAARRSSRP